MYVDNGKISSRQTFRLYVFDLLGIATLLLPPYLAKLCGADGIFAILLGTGAGFLYLFYLGWIMKHMKTDMCSYLTESTPSIVRVLALTFVLLYSILTAGFCACIFAGLMQYSLIQEASFTMVLLVILLVAAYAVSGGIESRARVYEVLFWFVLVPYVAMMLASVKDFEIAHIQGLFTIEGNDLWRGAYLVFLFLTPLFFSLFLIGEKEKNYGRNVVKTVAASIFVSSVILLGSYFLLVGDFGVEALANMKYPVVTLMSTIQFEGNFLKRMDALMLAVWFFTLYALLNLHLHYATAMLRELFGNRKQRENMKKKSWPVLVAAILVFVAAFGMQNVSEFKRIFVYYYSYVAVPIIVAGPGILLLFKRGK